MPHETLENPQCGGSTDQPRLEPWPVVEQTIPASNEGVRAFMESLGDRLAPYGLSEDAMGNVEIVLAEVLNNVVEHAYSDTGVGSVEIVISRNDTLLNVQIVDMGKSMPDLQLPQKRQADIDVDRHLLPEGGFGWFLIHELVEELSYSRRKGRNTVRIGMCMNPVEEIDAA